MRTPRILFALTAAALAIGALSFPAAAAGSTRWVDDDGKAGPTGCNGAATAKTTIQAAVNAASAGDTIVVCPGSYPENVVVGAAKDGLTIRAFDQWTATIRGAEGTGGEGSTLLRIRNGARDVTVRGLVFIWDAGQVNRTAGFGSCTLDAAIWVQGQNATILANRVRATGITYSPCGYVDAIRVGEPIDLGPAGGVTPASALVSHNALRDFVVSGITAIGDGVTATITRNSVRYWHLGGRITASAMARRAPASGWKGMTPAGPGFSSAGIALGLGASGEISGNEVSSGPDAQVLIAGQNPSTPGLFYGITSANASGVTIRGNTVRRTFIGYGIYGVIQSLLKSNVSIDHFIGIEIAQSPTASTNNRVADNQVGPGFQGIVVTGVQTAGLGQNEDNRIANNTVFGNEDVDCLDQTTGSGTAGTANTWVGNAGLTSDPIGICSAPK